MNSIIKIVVFLLISLCYAVSFAQDSEPPVPHWELCCCGCVHNYDYNFVEDMPNNGNSSNLASIELLESTNYELCYDYIKPGKTKKVNWWLQIQKYDSYAYAKIKFSDVAGNDTTITIEYYPYELKIRPNIEFTGLKVGDTVTKDCWLVNESKHRAVSIDFLRFQSSDDTQSPYGFSIEGMSIPFVLQTQDSVRIHVKFVAELVGIYKDSIGAADTCSFFFSNSVIANVGSPHISVNSCDFGTVDVGKKKDNTIFLKNKGNRILFISRIALPSQSIIFSLDTEQIINLPIQLQPNQTKSLCVTFAPDAPGDYLDSIVFYSDSDTFGQVDSIAYLRGRSIISKVNEQEELCENFKILTNAQNSQITVNYSLLSPNSVTIRFYDLLMREIFNVPTEWQYPGNYEKKIDVYNLSSGVYYCVLGIGNRIFSKALLLE